MQYGMERARSNFYVLRPPFVNVTSPSDRLPGQDESETVRPDIPGLQYYSWCRHFGFQYSMEWYYREAIISNVLFRVNDWRYADFIFVPHCASMIYFKIREVTQESHTDVLAQVERDYLLPIVHWAMSHEAHKVYNGRNFMIVFSMDLGMQEFPRTAKLIKDSWVIGSLANDPDYLARHKYYYTDMYPSSAPPTATAGVCFGQDRLRNGLIQRRIWKPNDFVISISSRFSVRVAKLIVPPSQRPHLFFFSGSMNSCARQSLLQTYGYNYSSSGNISSSSSGVVLVTSKVRTDAEYRMWLYSTRFCGVLCGASHTNNVRLYDVILHGCIPVIISDDFAPPLEDIVPWREMAVFLPTSAIGYLLDILESIPIAVVDAMHRVLTNNIQHFQWNRESFWLATYASVAKKISNNIQSYNYDKLISLSSP